MSLGLTYAFGAVNLPAFVATTGYTAAPIRGSLELGLPVSTCPA